MGHGNILSEKTALMLGRLAWTSSLRNEETRSTSAHSAGIGRTTTRTDRVRPSAQETHLGTTFVKTSEVSIGIYIAVGKSSKNCLLNRERGKSLRIPRFSSTKTDDPTVFASDSDLGSRVRFLVGFHQTILCHVCVDLRRG